jgi:thiol-disulfide isomerase/thioredoxin
MPSQFGPWTTAMYCGRYPQLSTFWRQWMARLPAVRAARTPQSAAAIFGLLVGVVALGVWPMFRVMPVLAEAPPAEKNAEHQDAKPNADSPPAGAADSKGNAPSIQGTPLSLDEIHAAWRKRQESIHSIRIKWTEAQTIPRGRGGVKDNLPVPPQDTTNEIKRELVLDGEKTRESWDGTEWDDMRDEFVPNSFWTASDGHTSRLFFEVFKGSPISSHPFPSGSIGNGHGLLSVDGNYHIELPLFSVRPLDPLMGCTRNPWGKEPTGPVELSTRMLGEWECTVIGQSFGAIRREIWVDRKADCSIRRYLITHGGNIFYQIDATFARDDKAGWLPASWHIDSWLGNVHALRHALSASANVTKLEVNPTIDVAEFRPKFPVGTMVNDGPKGEAYLVKPDGSSRIVLFEENSAGIKYDRLLATETGEDVRPVAVPDGNPDEVIAFIHKMEAVRSKMGSADFWKNRSAIVLAANKILASRELDDKTRLAAFKAKLGALWEMVNYAASSGARKQIDEVVQQLATDGQSELATLAKKYDIFLRMERLRGRGGADAKLWEDAKAELKSEPDDPLAADMAIEIAQSISESHILSAEGFRDLADTILKNQDPAVVKVAKRNEGLLRRWSLLGRPIEIKGTLLDGQPFDQATLKGKVVLVDFWATWCSPCRAELPNIKQNYEKYHARGFEVVGISLDDDKATLETFLAKEKIPWPTLFDDGSGHQGFKNPIAVYYSVWGVPTAILTDQKGEVISLDARSEKLDRLLEELLGK